MLKIGQEEQGCRIVPSDLVGVLSQPLYWHNSTCMDPWQGRKSRIMRMSVRLAIIIQCTIRALFSRLFLLGF